MSKLLPWVFSVTVRLVDREAAPFLASRSSSRTMRPSKPFERELRPAHTSCFEPGLDMDSPLFRVRQIAVAPRNITLYYGIPGTDFQRVLAKGEVRRVQLDFLAQRNLAVAHGMSFRRPACGPRNLAVDVWP